MKRFLIICFVLAGFASCGVRHYEGFNAYFWTSTEDKQAYLYIDGENRGVLPYLPTAPDCGNEELKKKILMIHLPSGTYNIVLKDSLEQTLYREELTIKRNKGSLTIANHSSYKKNGSRRVFKDSCIIEEFYY